MNIKKKLGTEISLSVVLIFSTLGIFMTSQASDQVPRAEISLHGRPALHDSETEAVSGAVSEVAAEERNLDDYSRLFLTPDGDDSNDGLSPGSAIATLARAHHILSSSRPDSDVHVVIAPGRYHGQQTTWRYANPPHRIRFSPLEDASGYPVFDGRLEDGSYPGGTWFRLRYSEGTDTNLDFINLHIINYWDAISLNGNREEVDGYSANNRIESCRFERIGNLFNPSLRPSTAVIRFVNSKRNIVRNNDFIDVVNVTGDNLIHAVYAAHMADSNTISQNRFINNSGDPIRTRDFSNGNYISDNFHIRSGLIGYSEWYCDSTSRDDCTKASPECPSWFNEYRNNFLVSGYNDERLSVFRFYQNYVSSNCEEPSEGARRLRTSGNVQVPPADVTSWDLWLHRNYGREERDRDESVAPLDIADGYNQTNLVRYALGIDQRRARQEDKPQIRRNAEGEIEVLWAENKEADQARVQLEYSTDNIAWTEVAWKEATENDDLWGRRLHVVTIPEEVGKRAFLRLRISMPEEKNESIFLQVSTLSE